MSEVRYWDTDMPINETRVSPNFSAYDRGEYQVKREGRMKPQEFLGNYAKAFNAQHDKDKNRGGATTAAAQKGGKTAKDVARQFGQMGDDITIEKGIRGKEWDMAGTPGKPGFLGTAVKAGIGMAFPGAGGMMANSMIGDRLDYM